MEDVELLCNTCKDHMLAIHDTLDLIGGKWKLKILTALFYGETHFMELQRRVTGIGAKMLSQELRDLEMNGMVIRTVLNTKPITVKYKITPYAESLKGIITDIAKWGINHRKKMIHGEN
jgi:DNA-binding HxlR family transcriptional regulator